jgi:hypothetical protein
VEGGIAIRPWRLRLEASGTYWGKQTASLPANPSQAGDFSLISVEGRAGYPLAWGAFELAPALLVEGDFMSASTSAASGVKQAGSGSSGWVALGGGAWIFVSLTREIALSWWVEADVPLARPQFEVTGTGGGTVHQPGVIGGKGGIGLEIRFF